MEKRIYRMRNVILFIFFAALFLTCLGGRIAARAEGSDHLILPDADTRYYTDADIADMSLQVINYAKNEIYARHGRIFLSSELNDYFRSQPWYSGTVSPDDFTDRVFNEYERANILLLSDREMALGTNGYLLDQPGYNFDAVNNYIASHYGEAQAETSAGAKAQTEASVKWDSDEAKTALEQYRMIVSQASSYQYDSSGYTTPSGNFQYALVQMRTEDTVPTLLLEQEMTNGIYYVLLFHYDPETGRMIHPAETMTEGVASAGGYRGGLAMEGDGNGIRTTEISSGTGQTYICRVTLENESLKTESQWSGRMDMIPADLGFVEIEWHDISDTTALEGGAAEASQPGAADVNIYD